MDIRSSSLVVKNVCHSYGAGAKVLDDFSVTVEQGEFVTLLGPSGSGKSTALRLIAGYIEPSSGTISLGVDDITHTPPRHRDIGMVFQHFALFPHMTVEENVSFGLKMRRLDKREASARVEEIINIVQLAGLKGRYPSELSGGQQQRVALARALAIRPRVLLFDEPLSSLDASLREVMQREIRRIQQELEVTTVYVTHDQTEALTMSDHIAVMNGGRIEQFGTPREVYDRPASLFVAKFIGDLNLLPGTIVRTEGHVATVQMGLGPQIDVPLRDRHGFYEGVEVHVAIRPECLRLIERTSHASDASRLPGRVKSTKFAGRHQIASIEVGQGIDVNVLDVERVACAGESVTLHMSGEDCNIFAQDREQENRTTPQPQSSRELSEVGAAS